jgi:hypothetical protein
MFTYIYVYIYIPILSQWWSPEGPNQDVGKVIMLVDILRKKFSLILPTFYWLLVSLVLLWFVEMSLHSLAQMSLASFNLYICLYVCTLLRHTSGDDLILPNDICKDLVSKLGYILRFQLEMVLKGQYSSSTSHYFYIPR